MGLADLTVPEEDRKQVGELYQYVGNRLIYVSDWGSNIGGNQCWIFVPGARIALARCRLAGHPLQQPNKVEEEWIFRDVIGACPVPVYETQQ